MMKHCSAENAMNVTWIIQYHTTLHHITSHYIASHHITQNHITTHHIAPRHTKSHHITPHHITSHHTTSHHITPHYTTPHHTTLYYTPHHTTPHHTTSHHITSHHTILHITRHRTTKCLFSIPEVRYKHSQQLPSERPPERWHQIHPACYEISLRTVTIWDNKMAFDCIVLCQWRGQERERKGMKEMEEVRNK